MRNLLECSAALPILLFLVSGPPAAHASDLTITAPLNAGQRVITGQITEHEGNPLLEVQVNKGTVAIADQSIDAGRFTITLTEPLQAGETVRIRDRAGGAWSPELEVEQGTGADPDAFASQKPPTAKAPEKEEVFRASAYLGTAYDNFAAAEVKSYINPTDSNTTQSRFIFGFDFEYLLHGSFEAAPHQSRLYIYGETLHGVRSADVDCSGPQEQRPPVCDRSPIPPNIAEQARFILREATSLEAFVGLRWEFYGLQLHSASPASLYLKGQAGFLSVSDIGGDVVDMHHLGLGIIAKAGRMQDSYVEFGFGRTDLFLDNPNRRWKIDGLLSFDLGGEKLKHAIRPFVQINVDSDFGSGSDSVQTYLGIDFDVGALFF